MISPANIVSLPTKVVWPIAFFLNSELIFCTTFVLATGQLTSCGVGAKAFDVHKSKAD